jgi:hypothetical protein
MAVYDPEPYYGAYDWEEAFRQNPDHREDTFCQDPDCDHPGCHGGPVTEESKRVMAALITVEFEEVLALEAGMAGHLDGLGDLHLNDDVHDYEDEDED